MGVETGAGAPPTWDSPPSPSVSTPAAPPPPGSVPREGEFLLGDPRRSGRIEAAGTILDGEQPVTREGAASLKPSMVKVFWRKSLDRMPKKCGDRGVHGAPLPGRTAQDKRGTDDARRVSPKMSLSMSDRAPDPK